jgi:hypothetical protein
MTTSNEMPSPTVTDTDARGYDFVETSNWWKRACEALPSFAGVHWPDYGTKVVHDTIDGKAVVIQLWKGWCQKFLGRDDFPGGIGAEVGIYHQVPGRAVPASLPHYPASAAAFLLGGMEKIGGDHLWWAYADLNAEIEFELVNPKTHEPFFSAGPQQTYWRNRWMNPDSYEKYRHDQHHHVPTFSAHYVLNYKINGKSYSW